MINQTALETLQECVTFLFFFGGIFVVMFLLFYFIIQQIRFWKGMRKMSFEKFLKIIFKNLDDE